jgi:hypothetical protein
MEALRHFIMDWSPLVLLVVVIYLALTIQEAVEALKDLFEVMGEHTAEKAGLLRAELDRYERETERDFPLGGS